MLTVFPVLYNIPLYLIYFIHSHLYLLISYPYFTPPSSLFPLVTTRLFYCICDLFLFCCIYLFYFFLIIHVSNNVQYWSFPEVSLSIIPSMSIHVVAKFYSFLWLSNILLNIYTTCLSIHLLMVTWIASISWLF